MAGRGLVPHQGRRATPAVAVDPHGARQQRRGDELHRGVFRPHRTQGRAGPHQLPGPARPPHRSAEPSLAWRPLGPGNGIGHPPRQPGGAAVPRPRPLQGGQRFARPPRRRPSPEQRSGPPQSAAARGRHGGPHRRRRIHLRHSPFRSPGDAGPRGAKDHRGNGRTARHRGRTLHRRRQRRHQRVPARRRRWRHPRAQCGQRHVQGQGARRQLLRVPHRQHDQPRDGAAGPGKQPSCRARPGRVRPVLPAADRPGDRPHRRRRSPDPLVAPQTRRRAARPFYPGSRRNGPHRRYRRLGAAQRLPAEQALAAAGPAADPRCRST